MLFCRFLTSVVGDVQFHELVKGSITEAKRGVLYALFVSYNIVVEGKKGATGVHKEVTITRQGTNWVRKESQMNNS